MSTRSRARPWFAQQERLEGYSVEVDRLEEAGSVRSAGFVLLANDFDFERAVPDADRPLSWHRLRMQGHAYRCTQLMLYSGEDCSCLVTCRHRFIQGVVTYEAVASGTLRPSRMVRCVDCRADLTESPLGRVVLDCQHNRVRRLPTRGQLECVDCGALTPSATDIVRALRQEGL